MSRNRRSQFNRPIAVFRGLVVGLGRVQIHSHDFSLPVVVHAVSSGDVSQSWLARVGVTGPAPQRHRYSGWHNQDCMTARAMHAVFLLILFRGPSSSRLTHVGFSFFWGRWQDQVLDFDTAGPVLHHASALVLSDSLTLCPGRGGVRQDGERGTDFRVGAESSKWPAQRCDHDEWAVSRTYVCLG